jgi:serine/threonine protein kinase
LSLEPGTRVGVYEVIALVGAGGMGQVYRARDTKLHRDVALKVLPDSVAADAERLERFNREARILAALDHPNIAHIHGLEEFQGVTALVMEFVDGDDLSQRLEHGPLPFDDALPVAKQIVAALEAAHERGVVHRDLKPANIKIRSDGTVKVLDFGLAKPMEAADVIDVSKSPTIASPAMTRAGVLLGTAAYMAPEQARGRAVDKRADVWAFGCVLFEMLTGSRAFPGTDPSETIAAVLKDESDYRLLNGKCPASVTLVVRRCLQRDPRLRIRDIGDVGLALDGAFAPSAVDVLPAAATPSRGLGWLIGFAAVAAAGAIAGFLMGGPANGADHRVVHLDRRSESQIALALLSGYGRLLQE